MKRFAASAYAVGRRDFVATVWSRTFALFLIGPLLIIAMSFGFGNISENVAREDLRVRVAVISDAAGFTALQSARERLNGAFGEDGLPELIRAEPDYDLARQTETMLASSSQKIAAVLSGGLDRPRLTGALREKGGIHKQVSLIVTEARAQRAMAGAGIRFEPAKVELAIVDESGGRQATMRAMTARGAQLLLFMLTVFLSTMLLSNLVEEKSSKVIEVLAAAVPVDAIFMGKLFAMLAVSIVGIAVWGAGLVAAMMLWPSSGGLPEPAVGWPLFALLVLLYYATNYLLLGALFLGIGAQATSVREVQTLSMPITIGQMLVFFFAFALGSTSGLLGFAAAAFPFSSPLSMVARAAQGPALWPHLVALGWQVFWVWLMIALGAALFRRNVLKSGDGPAGRPRLRTKRG
jgi:ABC-2 type transport system permease protein